MKVAPGVLCCFSVIPIENSEQHKLFFINIPRTDSVTDSKEMKAAQIISLFSILDSNHIYERDSFFSIPLLCCSSYEPHSNM